MCVRVCVHTRPRASPLIDGLIKPPSLLHPRVFALVQMFCVLACLCTHRRVFVCVCVRGMSAGIVCAQRCDKIGVKWNGGWRGDWIWENNGPVGQRDGEDAGRDGGGEAARKTRNPQGGQQVRGVRGRERQMDKRRGTHGKNELRGGDVRNGEGSQVMFSQVAAALTEKRIQKYIII